MILSKKNWLSVLLGAFILISLSCKKETTTSDPDPEPDPPCIVQQDVIITNSQSATIASDTAYVNGDTLYTIDLEVSQGNGLGLRLSSKNTPAVGKYTITNNILDLKEYDYKAFAQLYINTQVFLVLSGKVEVYNSDGRLRAKACNLQVSNPVGSNYSIDFDGFLE